MARENIYFFNDITFWRIFFLKKFGIGKKTMRRIDFIEEIERNRCSAVKLVYIRSIKCGIYKKLDRIYWVGSNAGECRCGGQLNAGCKAGELGCIYAKRKNKKRGNNNRNRPKSAWPIIQSQKLNVGLLSMHYAAACLCIADMIDIGFFSII